MKTCVGHTGQTWQHWVGWVWPQKPTPALRSPPKTAFAHLAPALLHCCIVAVYWTYLVDRNICDENLLHNKLGPIRTGDPAMMKVRTFQVKIPIKLFLHFSNFIAENFFKSMWFSTTLSWLFEIPLRLIAAFTPLVDLSAFIINFVLCQHLFYKIQSSPAYYEFDHKRLIFGWLDDWIIIFGSFDVWMIGW